MKRATIAEIVQEEEAEKLMVECFPKNFIDYEVSKYNPCGETAINSSN